MIYLDNSATTKPYKEVLDAFHKVSTHYFGNPSSLHKLGGESEKLLTQARKQISELLQVQPNEVLFTSGGTEGNNLAVKGTALFYRSRGKHIITSSIEHPSVRESFEQLKQLGFRVTYLPVNSTGLISLDDLKNAICDDTILVSIMHVNNEIGSIQPIKEIGQLLKKYPKIVFHVDDVQGVGKVDLPYIQWGIDLATISAHKFHGLKGNGVLFVRDGIHLSPLFSGGSQEWKQRSGTENVAGIVAMAKALRMSVVNNRVSMSKMREIRDFFIKELQAIDGISINTPKNESSPHIINFSIKGLKAEVFVHALEQKDIFVSTTSACSSKKKAASNTLIQMGLDEEEASSAIRISLTYENTMSEADQALSVIKSVIRELREVMK